jgi:hypothetical protein
MGSMPRRLFCLGRMGNSIEHVADKATYYRKTARAGTS